MNLRMRLLLLAALFASLAGCGGNAAKDGTPTTNPPASDRFDKSDDPALKGKAGPKAS